MEELIARITTKTGLDADTAYKAVGVILGFLAKEGPPAEVEKLMQAMPEAADAITKGEAAASGGGMMGAMGGMMGGGGGVMALGGKLMGLGVSMGQMQPLGKELFAYGREHAGEDTMGAIVGAVPGLGQFV
jgi:hypothetical protein